jgi:hypothetical protein
MRRLTLSILILIFSSIVYGEKSSSDYLYIATLEIPNQRVLTDMHQDSIQLFFDKWNNLYLPNGLERNVSIFSSILIPNGVFSAKKDELFFEAGNSLLAYWDSIVYAHPITGTRFTFKDGKLIDVMNRRYLGFDIAINDLLLLYDYDTKKPRGYLILDEKTRRVKSLNPEELIEYVRLNGERYELSLQGNAILYKGWTWEDSGSHAVWGDGLHAGWKAIDKDRLAYSYPEIYASDGTVVEEIKLNYDPEPGRNKYISSHTFDYEGNAFFFCSADVYYLGRDWGYEKTFRARITTTMELKLHAGSGEFKLGIVEKNEYVTLLEKTLQKETVRGLNASWYKVKCGSGMVGWVFGGYVDLIEGEGGILLYDSPAMKLKGLK